MSRWIKIGVVTLVALSLVAGIAGTALADPATPNAQHRGGGVGMGPGFGFGGIPASLADLLGLSEEQIEAQRHEGKSLVEIAKAAPKPADEAALVDAIVAERQKTVDERVADGRLTKEQAAQVMERIKERVAVMVNRTETGPDRSADRVGLGMQMGRRGGAGGGTWMRGGGFGNCPWAGETQSQTQ